MSDLSTRLALLTSPAILFFFVGAAAAFARSELAIPEPVAKALSLYLMLCIGVYLTLPLIMAANVVAYRKVFPGMAAAGYSAPPPPNVYQGI